MILSRFIRVLFCMKNHCFFKLFMCYFLLGIYFSSVSAGMVILLHGTSSAGKSSLAKVVRDKLVAAEKTVSIVGWDDCCNEAVVLLLQEEGVLFDPQQNIVEIAHHLSGRESKKQVGPKAEELLLKKIEKSAQENDYTIIDTLFTSRAEYDDFIAKITGYELKQVLVYVDPFTLKQQIEQRNASPDKADHRPLLMPFGQFFSIYQPEDADQGIDSLDTKKLLLLLQELEQYCERELFFGMSELERNKILADKEMVIEAYRLKELSVIALKSISSYDFFINLGNISLDTAAENILAGI